MTETKKPHSKPKELNGEDLAQARGGLAPKKASVVDRPKDLDDTARPFVVDGPYT